MAGAAAGGLAAALASPKRAGIGMVCGLFCAVPLVAAAALGVALLRRAGRARRGSVVARADGRALCAAAAGILGCSTALSLLDWPAAATGGAAAPAEASVLLLGAGAVVLLVLVADLFALSRVDRWALRILLDDGAPGVGAAYATGEIDMGVGDARVALDAPGTAYRGGGRAAACVLGDVDEARATLRRSVRRGAVLMLLLEALGFAHGVSRSVEAAAQYDAWLCDGGRLSECRGAALLTEKAGLPAREARRLHAIACDQGQEESCLALALIDRQAGPLW